jgi:tRNA A-37 threonylcarbamoyl transferase component Bud32
MRADRRGEAGGRSNESGVSKVSDRENVAAVPIAPSGAHAPATSGPRLPAPGDTIAGKYEVVRILGSGAMGVVYEAIHIRLRQRLAIKVLRPDVSSHDVLTRFEREAHASAQLRSVHAARVIDVDSLPNGLPYIVMEYLEGRDLDAELSATGMMPIELAVDIVIQVTDAMTEAHALGIVHRDLKPANLFVCRVGERRVVKVLDFGISKVESDNSRITANDEFFGTPSYASPEQLLATGGDARSDVWSLGVILFELLTGRTPFVGSSVQVIAKVLTDPIPWPVDLRPDLPRDLARVVMKALQRSPAQRFQSMREMAEALAPFGPTRSAAAVLAEVQGSRGRLGEILVADGLIKQADLDRALDTQRREGKLLGRVLLDMGLVGHADMLTALAKQQGLPTTQPQSRDQERLAREARTLAPAAPHRSAIGRRSRTVLALAGVVAVALAAAIAFGRVRAISRPAGTGAPVPAARDAPSSGR